VYTYDRRGRGESTDNKPYSVAREIEDLEAIVKETGESPFVCGFSSGAALLIRSVAHGLPAKKLALFEPPYTVTRPSDNPPPADAEATLTNFCAEGRPGEAVKYFMTKVMGMPSVIPFLFKLFARSLWKKHERVAHTLSYDLSVLGNFSVPKDAADKVRIPTIVIGGEKSPGKLRDAVRAVGQSISNSEISFLKGQSHIVSMKVLATGRNENELVETESAPEMSSV
jgi:pimeloyl-ACP methyl ester carboxylesterase